MTDSSYNYTNNGSELKLNTSLRQDSSDPKEGGQAQESKTQREKQRQIALLKKNLQNHRSQFFAQENVDLEESTPSEEVSPGA